MPKPTDRFLLTYPVQGQTTSITKPFSADGGIELAAPAGASIVAGAAGTISGVSTSSVELLTLFGGTGYRVLYTNLKNIKVQIGQAVNDGDALGESAGPTSIKVTVGQVVDPTTLLYQEPPKGKYVQPTADGIRLRDQPVSGKPVGQVYMTDILESLEAADATLKKLGVADQWLNVRTSAGVTGYVSAQYLQVAAGQGAPTTATSSTPATTSTPASVSVPAAASITGINLDIYHPQGSPDPARLKGLGWVRFGYNVSAGTGSEDINTAFNKYSPSFDKYAKAGYKVVVTFTHQTYGEGKNEFWPWPSMTDDKWRTLTARYADMMKRIAQQYAGKNLIHAFQIWNEQDAPIGAVASVPMTASNYAFLLSETAKAIRSVDSSLLVITGGHTGGPGNGSAYARNTLSAIKSMNGALPDGIAFHPYGRGTEPGTRYANFGHIDEEIKAYTSIMPDKPVWITEWGALDKEGDPPADVAHYAATFMGWIRKNYPGKVAAAIWYAWATGMHNGYGLVGRDDQPANPLYNTFVGL